MRRSVVLVAWGFVPLSVIAVIAGAVIEGRWTNLPVPLVLAATCTAVGALIVTRTTGNPVGWLLSGFGVQLGLSVLALSLAHTGGPLALWAAWVESSLWTVGFVFLVVVLPLIFPDGRIPQGWPRLVPKVLIIGWLLFLLGNALRPDHLVSMGFENPTAVPGLTPVLGPMATLGALLFAGCAIAAAVTAVGRYRASSGAVRLQHRWFAMSAVALVISVGAMAVAFEADQQAIAFTMFGLGATTVPIAVSIAVLRYRLYDIDRVISRTVSYALLSAALVGVYAASVVGLGAVVRAIPGGDGGDLVIAGSTLGVAALFGPLRRRVQALVDQRFNRARVDAQDTIARFSHQIRNDVDLDALQRRTEHVADQTMQPRSVSLWLRVAEIPS